MLFRRIPLCAEGTLAKSICRHQNGYPKASKTTLSLIVEPARGCMHVALGNPCENEYIES